MWRRLQAVLMVLWCVAGCMLRDGGPLGAMQGAVRRVGATPSPRVSASPSASPSPEETPTPYYASPAPYERIAYALPPGPDSRLWLYDRIWQELFVFPGAGVGLTNVAEWNPYQFYYDDRRNIYLLDALREIRITLVDGFEVGGFAFSPAFDGKNNLYFLGTDDPARAELFTGFAYVKAAPQNGTDVIFGISPGGPAGNGNGKENGNGNGNGKENGNGNGEGKGTASGSVLAPVLGIGEEVPLAPVLGKPIFLSKINAVGVEHGGISSINVCGTGDWVVFTTVDGGLYLYDTRRVVVQAIFADQEITGDMRAIGATIDPIWGRFVVWTDLGRRSVFVLDRWTRAIDTVPYAAIAWNAELVASPTFYGNDPFNVILLVLLADGTFRLMTYNVLTEQLTNLTLLNTVARGR